MSQNYGIAEVISRVPSIEISTKAARELLCNLHLPNNEPPGTNNLKQVVEHAYQSKSSLDLEDLVRALMLTPGLGRHVTKLLPFHKSYPVDVLRFLICLDNKWVKFADFIGFNEEDVDTIVSSAPSNIREQIKNFFKVWRMPDLSERKNKKILDDVLNLARITQEEDASQFIATQPLHQGQVHHHFYNITVHRDGSTESIPSTPETMPPFFGLPSRSSSGTHINPSSHGGNFQRLQSQQSDYSDATSPPTTRQLSQLSDSNSDTSGSFEQYLREHSVSADVSDEHHSSIAPALKGEQETQNTPELDLTYNKTPKSSKWTMNGSKTRVSSGAACQGYKRGTGGRTQPTAPGSQNQQSRKPLQTKREVKVKPQKASTMPSSGSRTQFTPEPSHNQKEVKQKPQKTASLPSYRRRSNISSELSLKPEKNEAQPHGTPKKGSKTGNEASSRNAATRQKQVPLKPTSARAPFIRQKQLQRIPMEPHRQPTKDISSSQENGSDISSMQPQETTSASSPQQHHSVTTPPPQSSVTPTATLGYGSYGEVLEVKYSEQRFAAKRYNEKYAPSSKLHDVFGKERGIVSKLNHPNVVLYLSICRLSTDGSEVIVMERVQSNFTDFMKDSRTLEKRISVMRDVARGLEYAHSQNPVILHCDLTANNVLITGDDRAKIADFGNTHMVDITTSKFSDLLQQSDTQDYMPPDALEGKISDKVDVFSFGHLLIYAIIQHQPHPLLKPVYTENSEKRARSEVERRQTYIVEMKENLEDESHPLVGLVNTCLSDEPEERPTIEVVLQKLHY